MIGLPYGAPTLEVDFAEEYDGLLLRLAELEIENRKLKKIEEEEVALENDWGDLDRDPRVAQQFREDWNAALILHGRNLQKREDEEGTSIDMRDRGSLGSWSVAKNNIRRMERLREK
ncbi:unnamed protein product [Caenorhabditis brenneri]